MRLLLVANWQDSNGLWYWWIDDVPPQNVRYMGTQTSDIRFGGRDRKPFGFAYPPLKIRRLLRKELNNVRTTS